MALYWSRKGYKVGVLTQVPSYPFGRVYKGYKNFLFQINTLKNIKIYRVFTVLGYEKCLILKILNYLNFMFLTSIIGLFIGIKYNKIFIFHTGPLTQALAGIIIKKIFKKEMTIWTQDVWPDTVYAYGFKNNKILEFMLNSFVKFIYKNCKNIFVSCEMFVNKIKVYVNDKTIHYFPNWADEFPKSIGKHKVILSKDKRVHFTFAGNIGKVQNLENIIYGFSNLPVDWKIQLNIIGDGSHLEYLKKLVKKQQILRVVFWGRKPSKEMALYYKASDVLIISLTSKPIFQLTIPSKFQTYLSVNKPVFCVMNGAVADIVLRYKLGIVIPPDGLKEIEKGFKKFYKMEKNKIKKYSMNSKELLVRCFNRETIMKNMTLKMLT